MPRIVFNQLNARQVAALTEPGTYADGQGLYLVIGKGDARFWMFRYATAGRVREMGLGSARDTPLDKARDLAAALRQKRRQGIDPADARKAKKLEEEGRRASYARTFEQCAKSYIERNKGGWKSAVHADQWLNTLTTYAFPVIGHVPVAKVHVDQVLAILEPIWAVKPETASRVRGRIETVLNFAKANGWRAGDNPAAWRGHLQNILPPKSRVARVQHHAAMPYRDVPAFMCRLREAKGVSPRALEFLILTAARTGEVIGATVREIERDADVWIVPPERMKKGREHRVPLTPRAQEIVRETKSTEDFYIFPGSRAGKPLSNMSMDKVLRSMSLDVTVHGFRSTFRDWAADQTAFPREVAEACLAHVNKDRVEAAYRRTDFLEKRRELLAAWADFCLSEIDDAARAA